MGKAAQSASYRSYQGTPVHALLVQGGLDESERESHISFRSKVDYWRLATGTETATAQAIDMLALTPTAPVDATALRYTGSGLSVVEVQDPNLEHGWPVWDIMAVIVDFFERS